MGKDGGCTLNDFGRRQQERDRLQRDDGGGDDQLRRSLMPEMAVRTMRIVDWTLMIPVADDACGKDHQRNEREGDCE